MALPSASSPSPVPLWPCVFASPAAGLSPQFFHSNSNSHSNSIPIPPVFPSQFQQDPGAFWGGAGAPRPASAPCPSRSHLPWCPNPPGSSTPRLQLKPPRAPTMRTGLASPPKLAPSQRQRNECTRPRRRKRTVQIQNIPVSQSQPGIWNVRNGKGKDTAKSLSCL